MSNKLSRREFLRNAAGVAAGIGAVNVMAACSPSTPAPAAPAATTAPAAAPAATTAPAAPAATAVPAAPAATAAPAAASGKAVKLGLWGGYAEMEPWYHEVTDAYTKAHPNVTFDIVTMGDLRGYEQKLAASLPSDTAADIIEVSSFISKFVDAGLIPDPPASVVEWDKASGRYDPAIINEMTFNGKIYGIPLFVGSTAYYYNKKMYAAAGLTKPPETFDELMEHAKKLVQKDASGKVTVAGHGFRLFGQGSGVAEKFLFYLWPAGGEIITQQPDGKWKNGYDNDAGRAALTFYMDGLYKYNVDEPNLKRDTEGFELQQVAGYFRESNVVGDIAKNAPTLEYASAPMPKGAKRWGHITQGISLYVTKASTVPDVAWDFITFAMGPQYMQDLLRNVGWLPARHDVDYAAVLKDIPGFSGFMVNDPEYKGWVTPSIPVWDEVETKMAEHLITTYTDKSLAGNPDGIAKAIKEMAAETDSILDKAGVLSK